MNPQDQTTATAPVPVAPSRLIRPGELFGSSWSLFKKNWKFLVGITATVFVCVGLTFLLFTGSIIIQSIPLAIICGILYFATIIVLGLTCYAALINAIHRLSTESNPALTIFGQFKFSLSLFWPFFLLIIIVALVTYGSIVLLVIPGILVGVYTCLSLFTFVIDGKRGFGALIESYSLVKGRWWATFGRLVLLAIVCAVAGIIYEIVMLILASVLGAMLPSVVVSILVALAVFVFEAGLVSYIMVYMYQLYTALKKTRTVGVSDTVIRPWLISFLILGIFVFIAYAFFIATSFVMGFGRGFDQIRQNAYRAQMMNNVQIMNTMSNLPQQQ